MSHSQEEISLQLGTALYIAFLTFIGILVYQLANVTCISQCLRMKYAALKVGIKNLFLAEELMSPTSSLPDRLINPGDYEPPFNTL